MTPHNITNSANNLKITELALYNIVEFQAFGSRPLRKENCKSKDLQFFCVIEDEVRAIRVRHRAAKNYLWNIYVLHLCAVLAVV